MHHQSGNKRSRSKEDSRHGLINNDEFGATLEHQPSNSMLLSPPHGSTRPSKIRRHGSKILSVLRSLTSSASSVSQASNVEGRITPPAFPSTDRAKELVKKVSMSFVRTSAPPTVVRRSQPKSRPSLGSLDKGVTEITPEVSPSTSGETSGNSGSKQAPRNNSTGMTSLDSKFSAGVKLLSGHSSENKKVPPKPVLDETAVNNPSLAPIVEAAHEIVELLPIPVPTVITVEKAAAAKIFFECYYNGVLASGPSPRSLRLREFEGLLYENASVLNPAEQELQRREWARRETNYLREVRAMKSRKGRKRKGMDAMVAQYDVVKVLGKGSFGVVRLVRERDEPGIIPHFDRTKKKDVYAMKAIRKSDMLRNSQEGHLRAERDFLVASEGSRWVVPLIASFQDASNLYLIMDYMPGGDFLGLLIRDNILSESVAKWYIAEMILCIEEAHRFKWIHRDIKPDNFLISASGHLKISDFGLAFDGHWSHDQAFYNNHRYSLLTKLGINVEGDSLDKKDGRTAAAAMKLAHVIMGGKDQHEKKSSGSQAEGILNWRNRTGNRALARSVVGTSQYMAPEVVRGELYDARCDWWSVAVILYECLYGHTPFLADEGGRAQTKLNILNHRTTFSFPTKQAVSSRCQDLIKRMIQEKDDRLCSRRYKTRDLASSSRDYVGRYVYPDDAEDIKAHRWFKDILWDRIHLMTPPFVPAIKSLDDTHYFDEEEPISDFSTSHDEESNLSPPTEEELNAALRCFNREIQILARDYVGSAYDSTKLRHIEREIDGFVMSEEQKEYLRGFVRAYGRKEKKRPRDRLLRDGEYRAAVLECRKRGAFLGYSWRRIRKASLRELRDRATGLASVVQGERRGKAKIWMRGRLSIN